MLRTDSPIERSKTDTWQWPPRISPLVQISVFKTLMVPDDPTCWSLFSTLVLNEFPILVSIEILFNKMNSLYESLFKLTLVVWPRKFSANSKEVCQIEYSVQNYAFLLVDNRSMTFWLSGSKDVFKTICRTDKRLKKKLMSIQ